jgi:hypothetical protein
MARTWVRRLAKIGGYGILVLLVLAALALTFTVGWRPVIGANKRRLTTRTGLVLTGGRTYFGACDLYSNSTTASNLRSTK